MRAFSMGPATVAPALVNRALEHEGWAREALAAHARELQAALEPSAKPQAESTDLISASSLVADDWVD